MDNALSRLSSDSPLCIQVRPPCRKLPTLLRQFGRWVSGSRGGDLCGADFFRGPVVTVIKVVPAEEVLAEVPTLLDRSNVLGKSGREWLLVTLRSANRNATEQGVFGAARDLNRAITKGLNLRESWSRERKWDPQISP